MARDHPWFLPTISQPDFRSLIFLHVHNVKRPPAWAVMDIGGFFCMYSQQSSTNNYGCYNNSIRADHAVTKIVVVPSAPMHQDLIKYKLSFSSNEKETLDFFTFCWSFGRQLSLALTFNPCNSCNLQIIVNSSPPPCDFFQFVFPRKNPVSFVLCIIFSHTRNSHSTLSSLVVRINRLIAYGENFSS